MSSKDRERTRLEAMAAASAARGRAIFHLDLAAALATDHVRAIMPDPHAVGLSTWIVDVGPNGHEVLFLTGGDPLRTVFRVTFAADGRPLGERLNEEAPFHARIMARAKKSALAHRLDANGTARMPVVIPVSREASPDAPIEVYLLASASVPGDVAIGPHWRVLVSAEGARIVRADPLSRSDLTLQGSNGAPPEAIMVTHLSSEAPTEVHVYLSLKHARPIDVATIPSNGYWRVDGDEIAFLRFLDT